MKLQPLSMPSPHNALLWTRYPSRCFSRRPDWLTELFATGRQFRQLFTHHINSGKRQREGRKSSLFIARQIPIIITQFFLARRSQAWARFVRGGFFCRFNCSRHWLQFSLSIFIQTSTRGIEVEKYQKLRVWQLDAVREAILSLFTERCCHEFGWKEEALTQHLNRVKLESRFREPV